MFEFQPTNVTKQLLLSQNSEEAYFAYYMGINPKPGLFRSPLRKDDNPTCSFYRNRKTGELIFKDFGDGFHGNFVSVVMHILRIPYYKALDTIANDFGIIKKPHYEVNEAKIVYDGTTVEEKEETVIQVEVKDFSQDELEWWAKQGVSQKTLKKGKVFSIKNVFLNGSYFCSSSANMPIYGYYFGTKDGRELWKLYFPFKKKYRFMLNCSVLQGLKLLPKEGGKYVVVTKSYKDVLALYELGIPAIAPQAESVQLTQKQFDFLASKFEFVIFNGDWDRSGQRFMIESRKKFKSICLAFTKKAKFGKDMAEFIAKHGREKAEKLIEKLIELHRSGRFDYQFSYSK